MIRPRLPSAATSRSTEQLCVAMRTLPARFAGVLLMLSSAAAHAQPAPGAPPGGPSTAPIGSPWPGAASAPPALPPAQPATPYAPPSPAPSVTIPNTPAPVAPGGLRAPATPSGNTARPPEQSQQQQDEAANALRAELEPKSGGLTADEIVAAALQHSPALAKSILEADKAAANQARAKLAFAPRIDLMAKYTRLSKVDLPPPVMFNGQTFRFNQPIWNQYATQASLMLPITDYFLTIVPTYKAAGKMAQVAAHQRRAQELQVAYDARVAFYNYVHLTGAVAVTTASVKTLEAGLRDLEALVAAGTATNTELVRAKSQLAAAQQLHIQAEGGLEVARQQLMQITGTQLDFSRGVGEPFIGIEIGEPPTMEQVRSEAKQTRPELAALRTLKEAREHLLRARKGGMYPQIRGTANAYYSRPNQRIFPQVDEFRGTWDVGIGLSWSPNDAVFANLQANDAETDLRVVNEDMRLLEQGIAMEVASAVTNHKAASAGISAKTEAYTSALRYHADQRALLLAGAATPNDVLLAERDLIQAALEWVDSFVQARIAQAGLLKAQGKTSFAAGGATRAP